MKTLLSLLLAFLPVLALAQELPRIDNKIVYSEVVPVEGAQAELYARAVKAITPSAKEVIKQESNAVAWQDSKQLMVATNTTRLALQLKYSVILQQKDGRYMYSITDFLIEEKRIKGLVPLEESTFMQPVPEKHYFPNGNLKPLGLAHQNLSTAHKEAIEKAVTDEIQRIKMIMGTPTSADW
ncbi:hypothetical protein [Pontibacter burrus]|uniref:DUF4468 domain-containing protein n=1 Tax=Pontibacter burrus TaxID=2704466 RepID=A0A6B3LRN9_9BACT|nr:hypothetical protein [Pontibacter burrus]NEM96161.1 hypothetical protein [Pontibacter burrus]